MINQIVQVIAPKRIVDNHEDPPFEINEPDIGLDILVEGSRIFLREAWWFVGTPPKYWWVAYIKADSVQPLIDWNDTPGNIGWISRSRGGGHNAPTDADAEKIWAYMRDILIVETPPVHNFWWVSGKLPSGEPDMDDPVIQPTISDSKLLINQTLLIDKAGLWSGTSSATNPQLNAWLAAHNDLGWKGSLPVLASAEGRLLVRKIALLANNSSKFQGE